MKNPRDIRMLLTGLPGCGKTTLIKKIITGPEMPIHGFITAEIRKSGKRVGFEAQLLSDPLKKCILSHINIDSRYRVGKYGVDIESFERLILPELHFGIKQKSLLIIDEIGKMELFSEKFAELVFEIMKSGISIIASISYKYHPVCDAIKRLPGIELITVNQTNRDKLAKNIQKLLQRLPESN